MIMDQDTPTLSPITEADVEPLAALWQEAWRVGHLAIVAPELLAARTTETFRLRTAGFVGGGLVARRGDTLMGFSYWKDDELDQFHVGAEGRGTGLAAWLMARTEAAMAAEGTRKAHLFCTAGNHRAHRFYVKTGWHDTGVEATRVPTGTGDFLTVSCHRFVKELG